MLKVAAVEPIDAELERAAAARCGALLIEQAAALRAEVLKFQADSPHQHWSNKTPARFKASVYRLLGAALDAAVVADSAERILAESVLPRVPSLLDADGGALIDHDSRFRGRDSGTEAPTHAADGRHDGSSTRAADLLAANEHLVLAALKAETVAATAEASLSALARSSERDVLTDTLNRALMLDRLKYAIAMAHRHDKRLAVLFVDLDDFKHINDTYGHAVGDAVLQRVARHLESAVRASDAVSRHGGDEFLVLLTEVSQRRDVTGIAAKMLLALSQSDFTGTQIPSLSASIGISMYPEDGIDAAALISRADTAMYRAKKRGRNRFECYAEQVDFHPMPQRLR